jgi:dihydropteroate synthase
VSLEEELARVLPVVEALAAETEALISIDTYKSAVAREALAKGAHLVNDISGLRFDAAMAETAAEFGAAVITMHIQGTPRNMQERPRYDDVIGEISDYLAEGIALAEAAGVGRDRIVVDPGFGFGKTVEHNLELMRRLGEFRGLGCPVMIGPSRKRTIGALLNDAPPDQRLEGTAAMVALGIASGADIVRVHDVKEMVKVARVADAVVRVQHAPPPGSEHKWAHQRKGSE